MPYAAFHLRWWACSLEPGFLGEEISNFGKVGEIVFRALLLRDLSIKSRRLYLRDLWGTMRVWSTSFDDYFWGRFVWDELTFKQMWDDWQRERGRAHAFHPILPLSIRTETVEGQSQKERPFRLHKWWNCPASEWKLVWSGSPWRVHPWFPLFVRL